MKNSNSILTQVTGLVLAIALVILFVFLLVCALKAGAVVEIVTLATLSIGAATLILNYLSNKNKDQ